MTDQPDALQEPLRKLLGARSANSLEKDLGMVIFDDLLRHYPRKYLQLGELTSINSLPLNEPVSLVAEVKTRKIREIVTKNNRKSRVMNLVVTDGKAELKLAFFHGIGKQIGELTIGTRALFTGKVTEYRQEKQLAHPLYELLKSDADLTRDQLEARLERPFPVYRATANTTSTSIRNCVQMVLDTLGEVVDPLPAKVRLRRGLLGLASALELVHRPDEIADTLPALRRLKFEEAFYLQTALAWRRAMNRKTAASAVHPVKGGLRDRLDARLPFALTAGQVEVGEQIANDMAQSYPMHRLLQGEVGSGKTLVALRAMLAVVDDGGQAALLAPTEVLAAQHHRSITAMLGDLAAGGMLDGDERGTRVALLTGSLNAAARRKAMLDAASGDAGIVIGTHAMLEDKVLFADLGLIVVDEQHRFGVEQRDAMRRKGITAPHLLVMTATPIPRTVAMTVFGDLETSTLKELPAGRAPITTHVVNVGDRRFLNRIWQRIAEEARAGHQSYVVCPRIGDQAADEDEAYPDDGGFVQPEEPKRRPSAAVVDVLEHLRNGEAFRGLVVEALHGRMPVDERDDVMRRFTAGKVDVLIATTVIEVGVDVPNATVMAVLDADWFGVSQLHQLRGRIGRGAAPGLCFLVTSVGPSLAAERLKAVASTVDGFELAQVDLEQRREGDVLGSKQSGAYSSLKLLKVLRDGDVIAEARAEAVAMIEEDPRLRAHRPLVAKLREWLGTDQAAYLERG